jgi:hypothetical protein
MSAAKSHKLANTSPKVAGIKMKTARSNVLSPGSKKGSHGSHNHRGKPQDSDPSRPGAPGFHCFDKDQSERQGSHADIDIDERQLEQPSAALKKKRIPPCLGDDESGSGQSESERGQKGFAIFNHVAITRGPVESFPILSNLRV